MKKINVIADAKRQRKDFKGSGAWLQRSVSFNPDLHLNAKNLDIANILFDSLEFGGGYKDIQKRTDFQILLANLFSQTRRPISISLNRNDYKPSQYSEASYFTIDHINNLHSKQLIHMEKGYHTSAESRQTRIWATDELLEIFPEYQKGVDLSPKELVILKDGKGKLKPYDDTAETRRVRAILALVNGINAKTVIKYHSYQLKAILQAVFIERFTWYGRLHTKGFRHYQGFNQDERKEFTINGDPLAELDYSALGPNLLYASIGKQYWQDPYSVIDDRPQVRKFLKNILIAMINAKDETEAEKAANNWLRLNPLHRRNCAALGITRAKPLMERFMIEHQPIADFFCKGKKTGLKIMNQDSKIALDIINHFAKQGKPILAVHDSFLVQKQHEEELRQIMKATYKRHTNFRIRIK
jgi:hypothetical protein